MGIMTRQLDDKFVVTSDRPTGTPTAKRAPARLTEDYQVWTGESWSADRNDALSFASLNEADDYVRINFAKLMV